MILRLNPQLPILWRSTDCIQIGVDDPTVTINGVTIAEERMLVGLGVGLTRQGLSLIGVGSGLSERSVAEFCRTISPALDSSASVTPALASSARSTGTAKLGDPNSGPSIAIAGAGPTVDRLVPRVKEAGFTPILVGVDPVLAVSSAHVSEPILAIVVGHYVLDPQYYGLWLRRDVTHLPIIYGDKGVQIGPLIQPGISPCLHCIHRHRTDADQAWPTIATQLLGMRSPIELDFLASQVAGFAARILHRRTLGLPVDHGTSYLLDRNADSVTAKHWLPHPDCSCTGIDNTRYGESPATDTVQPVVTRLNAWPTPPPLARQGTGTARSYRHADRSPGTRRDIASSLPA